MDFATVPSRELAPSQPSQSSARASALRIAITAAPALLLGLGSALVYYFAAGDVLGLYFGGIAASTLLAPTLVLAEDRLADRAIVWASLVLSIAAVWLVPVFREHVLFGGWFGSVLVLASYSAAIAGIAAILHRTGLASTVAAAIAIVLGFVWLTWPIWLCPWLTWGNRQAVVGWLVGPHPLMTINGALRGTYAVYWPHHKLAYQLCNVLNDIPYELPHGVLACVLLHLGVAGAAVGMLWRFKRPLIDH